MSHFKSYSKEQFREYLWKTDFKREISRIVIHYLWRKKRNVFWGEKSLIGLEKFYKKHGRRRAFNLCVNGNEIWEFLNIQYEADHSASWRNSVDLEVDAVIGHRPPTPQSWDTMIFIIDQLLKRLDLQPNDLYLHSELDFNSDCPFAKDTKGMKEWLLKQINKLNKKMYEM